MKTIILIVMLLASQCLPTIQTEESDFCDGWEEGYCEGWKDVKGQLSVCPVTPVCPIAPVDCTSYKCGYNVGFKAGRKSAKEY